MDMPQLRRSLLQELAALTPPDDITNETVDAYVQARDAVLTRLQEILKAGDPVTLAPDEVAALETAMGHGRTLEERVAQFRDRLQHSLTALGAARRGEQSYAGQTGRLVRTTG